MIRRTPSLLRALAFGTVTVLAAGRAAAEEATIYMPVGLLASASNRAAGIGGELTLDYYNADELGFGLLGQYEWLSDGGRRFAGGAQVIFLEGFVGVEAAVARYEKSAAETTALHLAPFLSCGFLSAALRFDIPLAHTGAPPPVLEVGLAITLKMPLPLNGRMRPIGLGG